MRMRSANWVTTPLLKRPQRPNSWLTVLLILFAIPLSELLAEGTRQLSPASTDHAMLETNRVGFGNFAAFNGPDESRLYISVKEASEIIYLGLSSEYDDDGEQLLSFARSRYRFRIRRDDPTNGNPVVHGPFTVNLANANVNNWDDAVYGNYDVDETQNGELMYVFDPEEAGDYFIEFEDIMGSGEIDPKVLIGYWDISVVENDMPQSGRIWSKNWALRTPPILSQPLDTAECKWNREFNGELFSYTSDGFVSKIDFFDSGFQGLSFNVVFNSKGPGTSGGFGETRKSIPGINATSNSAEHKIFLNEPDIDLFPNGECGQINSEPIFNCQTDSTYCLDVEVTRPGLVEIYLDFNLNNQFDPGTADVSLTYEFTENELSACVPWDGLTGLGTPAGFGDVVNIIFVYSQGVQNWAVYDAEFMKRGFCVERVRPTCDDAINTDILYWDDTNFLATADTIPGTGQPLDGRGGCPCRTDGCRTWNEFSTNLPEGQDCEGQVDSLTTGFGDKNTLNTWWFANIIRIKTVNVPLLTCQINGDNEICQGDTTSFTVQTTGTSTNVFFNWSGPGIDGVSSANTGPIAQEGEYCVTVTDEEGCSTVCCETLTFVDSIMVSAVAENANCFSAPNGQITVSASGGSGSFFYSINGDSFVPENIFTGLVPGLYTITVLDTEGCSETIDIEVGADFPDLVAYPDTLYICPGDTTQIIPDQYLAYDIIWSPAQGLSDATVIDPLASPEQTTTYTAEITIPGAPSCTYTEEVTVLVYPQIGLSVDGAGSVCAEEATLTAFSEASDVTFSWFESDGTFISNGAEVTVTFSNSASYLLVGEDAFGCTEELEVDVQFDPVEVSLADTVSVCLGEEVVFDIQNLDPTDTLSYEWTPVTAFDGPTNIASPDFIETLGVTDVNEVITNQHGCTYMQDISVAVIDSAIDLSFTSELACDGIMVDFTNTSTNAFGYLWDFGDGTTSTDENPTHVYSPGTYVVTLGLLYDASCVMTVSETITINEPQLVADFEYEIMDGNCQLDSAIVSFTDLSINSFGNDLQYNWNFGGLGSSAEANPVFTFAENGSYDITLEITTENGCTSTAMQSIDIMLIDGDSINIQDTLIQCVGAQIVLNEGGSAAYDYEWTPATGLSATNVASPTVMATETTTYTVNITTFGSDTCVVTLETTVFVPEEITVDAGEDVITCGEDVALTATSNINIGSYEWFTLSGNAIGNTSTVVVNPFNTETYIVRFTDEFGCFDTDTVLVIDNGVDIESQGDISSCLPIETTIGVDNLDPLDNLVYSWEPLSNIISGADTATPLISVDDGEVVFTLTVTNQFGCVATEMVTVNVGELNPGLADTIRVCVGETAELGPNANPNFEYEWSPATGLTDTDIPNPIFVGTESTSYTVTVTDPSVGFDCSSILTVEVIVSPLSDLVLTGGGLDTTICEPGSFTLTASAPGNINVDWYDNAELTPPAIGSGTNLEVVLTAGDTTLYAVTTDDFGCSDTSSVNLSVTDFMPGIETDTLIQVCADLEIGINPNGNPAYTYEWSPEDGLDLTEPWNPVVQTSTPLSYQVTITDPQSGCSVIANVDIEPIFDSNLELSVEGDLFCELATYTITATTNVTAPVQWYADEALTILLAEGSAYEVTLEGGSNTIWAVTGQGTGCESVESITIEANPFEPGILGDTTIQVCAGLEIGINPNGNPDYTYEWSPEDGLDLTEPWNPVVQIENPATYNVTITDPATGCSLEAEVVLEPIFDANLELSVEGDLFCELATYTITATTDVTAPVQWYADEALTILLAEGSTYEITLEGGSNTIWAVAGQGTGCESVESITIEANPFEPGILGDTTIQVCAGLEIGINPNGNPDYTYEWSPEDGLDLTEPWNPVVQINESATYSVTITDLATGCSLEAEVVLEPIFDANLELSVEGDLFCELATYTITATTDVTAPVQWYADEALTILLAEGSTYEITLEGGSNTIWAVAGQGTGCESVESITIEANPFEPGILGDTTIQVCAGLEIGINPNGNPDYTYEWSPEDGLDLTEPWNPVVQIENPATYNVIITDPATGCSLEAEVVLEPIFDANLELMAEDVLACELSTVTITATTDVTAPVQWYADEDLTIFLAEGDTYELLLEAGENTIFATAGAGTGCADTASITIEAEIFEPGIEGDTTIFVCAGFETPINPNGNPNYDYEWVPDDNLDITEPWNPTITTFENDTIQMTATDPVTGCTLMATVIVIPVEDAGLEVMPGDTSVCFIGPFELSASTSVPTSINWYTDDFNTFLGTGNDITVDLQEGENIICAIAGEGTGCADTVCVSIQATDFQTGLSDVPFSVCSDTPTPINPDGNPAYTYEWSPEDGLDLTEPWNPVISTEVAQTYQVTVTDPVSGCSTEDSLSVIVFLPAITLETEGDTTLCAQEEIPLTANVDGTGVEVIWYDNPNLDADPIGTGEMIDVIPDVGATIFVAVATDLNGCQDTSWVHVDVILVEPNLTSPITTCEGEPTPLNPNGNPNLIYSWEPASLLDDPNAVNPTTVLMMDTIFDVTITDSTGFCVLEDSVEVMVLPDIDVMAATDTTICEVGGEVLLEAMGSNGNVDYAWYDNPELDGTPFSTDPQVTVTPDESTIYYVLASYGGACGDIDSVIVIVEPIDAVITSPVTVCEPLDTYELAVTNLNPDQELTFEWSPANAIISDPTAAMVVVDPNEATDFEVIVTNEEGCSEVFSTSITIIELELEVDVLADPEEILQGESSTLSVVGCDNCTYFWEGPGTISDPTSQNPTVTPDEAGTLIYTVTVNNGPCSAVLDVELVVREAGCDERYVFLPDAFTPNNDGVNDILYLRSNSVVEMYLVIYNRWGQKMFETRDQTIGWDGTFQGEELPPDVYGYYLEYICVGETEARSYHGNVSILK